MKILIMGLPGSGKTTLAEQLKIHLEQKNKTVDWYNADKIRESFNDWDFSYDGRIRQSERMYRLSEQSKSDYIICDFVAPLLEMRNIFKADKLIWMDTIVQSEYENTNKSFVCPQNFDYRIVEKNVEKWSKIIADDVLDYKKD